MSATVVRIERGFSNGTLRSPYAYAVLNCGHSVDVVYAKEAPWAAVEPPAVGTVVACQGCDWRGKGLEKLSAAIAEGGISHSRVRSWGGRDVLYVYRYAPDSPTGVRLAVELEECPEAVELLRAADRSFSPLSPTEPR